MMYCAQCGNPNADGARFCSNCGSLLAESARQPQETSNHSEQQQSDPKALFRNRWRSFVRSPLMLVAIAVYALVVILSLDGFRQLLSNIRNISYFFVSVQGVLILIQSFAVVLPPVILVGLILMCLDAFRKDNRPLRSDGPTLVFVGVTGQLSVGCLSSLMAVIIGIENIHFMGTAYFIGELIGFVIIFAYMIFHVTVANNSRLSVEKEIPDGRSLGSAAGLRVFMFVFLLVEALATKSRFTLELVANLAAYILFAVAMFKYQKQVAK